MNAVLWIVAVLLAGMFLMAGAMKLMSSKEKLRENMGWVDDYSEGTIKMIGGLEILAAIGLVVPPLIGVVPVLAPLAAVGLVLLMLGAIRTHASRSETQMIVVNVMLLLLAAFVAWGRFGPESFS